MKAKRSRANPTSVAVDVVRSSKGLSANERRALEYVFTKRMGVLESIDRGLRAESRK